MKRFFPALPLILLAPSLMAADYSPSGEISSLLAGGLFWTHDNAGQFLAGELNAGGSLKVYGEKSSAYIDGRLTFDALKARSASSRFDFVTDDSSVQLSLKEAWLDYEMGLVSFRIGRQIEAWGKADGLQVTDILCPKDERNMIASSYSDSRLGIDGVKLSLNTEKIVCQGYHIPFFTPSALPLADGNPIKKIMIPQSISMGKMTAYINEVTSSNFTLPDTALYNSEGAVKISSYLSLGDFSLYGFYGFDREPLLSYSGENTGGNYSITVKGSYKRMAMLGFDGAIPVKEVVFRFEGAFYPRKYFSVKAERQLSGEEAFVQKDNFIALAGFDWMPSSWTITAQYYLDYLSDSEDEIDRHSYEHKATLSLSKSLLEENLKLSLSGILGLNDFDSMISAKGEYALTDSMKITLGGDFFIPGPEEKGKYGKYQDLSCLYLKAKYCF